MIDTAEWLGLRCKIGSNKIKLRDYYAYLQNPNKKLKELYKKNKIFLDDLVDVTAHAIVAYRDKESTFKETLSPYTPAIVDLGTHDKLLLEELINNRKKANLKVLRIDLVVEVNPGSKQLNKRMNYYRAERYEIAQLTNNMHVLIPLLKWAEIEYFIYKIDLFEAIYKFYVATERPPEAEIFLNDNIVSDAAGKYKMFFDYIASCYLINSGKIKLKIKSTDIKSVVGFINESYVSLQGWHTEHKKKRIQYSSLTRFMLSILNDFAADLEKRKIVKKCPYTTKGVHYFDGKRKYCCAEHGVKVRGLLSKRRTAKKNQVAKIKPHPVSNHRK